MSMKGIFRLSGWLFLLTIHLVACDSQTDLDDDDDTDPARSVRITINTAENRSPISPYIYGSNHDLSDDDVWTVRRQGGNRLTGYNWENNNSNAGNDWQHTSDDFLVWNAGIPGSETNTPGIVMTHFHDRSRAMDAKSVLTVQMAGYVAKDRNGNVSEGETAPSPRWVEVKAKKEAPFEMSPDLTDGAVYMDELINFLVQRYGAASSPGGVAWYSLDNEPALWSHTHPRIHPDHTGAEELIERSIALAKAVKEIDPSCEIVGPALYGMTAYEQLQDAPDWDQLKAGYDWFIDYYLDQMRQAEEQHAVRLLDVLDVHWYSEAKGDNRITEASATTQADFEARLQAPRTLWDPSYVEDSWIGQWRQQYLPLLTSLKQSIDTYYPDTKLAFAEYYYGGGDSISGGLAQVDVLGIFGKYGVYLATIWPIGDNQRYISAAFNLYRNYDGAGGEYGNMNVKAETEDAESTSVYASIQDDNTDTLHIIAVNKESDTIELDVAIQSETNYSSIEIWTLGSLGLHIQRTDFSGTISNNTFSHRIGKTSAVHIILK